MTSAHYVWAHGIIAHAKKYLVDNRDGALNADIDPEMQGHGAAPACASSCRTAVVIAGERLADCFTIRAELKRDRNCHGEFDGLALLGVLNARGGKVVVDHLGEVGSGLAKALAWLAGLQGRGRVFLRLQNFGQKRVFSER